MVIGSGKGNNIECVFWCGMLQGHTTIAACEYFCKRYYRCDNIAEADDELKEWEAKQVEPNMDL